MWHSSLTGIAGKMERAESEDRADVASSADGSILVSSSDEAILESLGTGFPPNSSSASSSDVAESKKKRYSMLVPATLAPTVYCPPTKEENDHGNGVMPAVQSAAMHTTLVFRPAGDKMAIDDDASTNAAGAGIANATGTGIATTADTGIANTTDAGLDGKVDAHNETDPGASTATTTQNGIEEGDGIITKYRKTNVGGGEFYLVPAKHIFGLANFHALENDRDGLKCKLDQVEIENKIFKHREKTMLNRFKFFQNDFHARDKDLQVQNGIMKKHCRSLDMKIQSMGSKMYAMKQKNRILERIVTLLRRIEMERRAEDARRARRYANLGLDFGSGGGDDNDDGDDDGDGDVAMQGIGMAWVDEADDGDDDLDDDDEDDD